MADRDVDNLHDRCINSRTKSDMLRSRSHRLIIESEVLSCAFKLQIRLLDRFSTTPVNTNERTQNSYRSAISKLLRYAER